MKVPAPKKSAAVTTSDFVAYAELACHLIAHSFDVCSCNAAEMLVFLPLTPADLH